VPHRRRPALRRRSALHVTVKLVPQVGRLRRFRLAPVLRQVFVGSAQKEGFRICQFSIQGNHIHLIAEADSKAALSSGMRGFNIRLGRRLNRKLERSGQVVADRYHTVELTCPRQTRATLCYVLNNALRHGERLDPRWGGIDAFSSAWHFEGWASNDWRQRVARPEGPPPVAPAESWLLLAGWKRHALVWIDEIPAAAARSQDGAGAPQQ
jgi:REP element-mobilizing transposase RayT